MNNQLVYGSLGYISEKSGKPIAETFLNVDGLLMIDISASMAEHDCGGGYSRYAVAVQQLERLQKQTPGKLAIVQFNHHVMFQAGGLPDQPYGSTDIAGVLNFIRPADNCGIKLILISDGEPDNEQAALDIARTFQSPTTTVYVGPEGGSGADFLRKLSALTGGQSVTQSVEQIAQLSQTVSRLLTA